jgi:hypothetical protein
MMVKYRIQSTWSSNFSKNIHDLVFVIIPRSRLLFIDPLISPPPLNLSACFILSIVSNWKKIPRRDTLSNLIMHTSSSKDKRAMMALRLLTCIKAPGAGPV